MIGLITTLSTQGTTGYQPTDSEMQLRPSIAYLINTLNITSMKVLGTTDSDLKYKLNRHEDRTPEFILRVNETNAAVQALADIGANSSMVLLNVLERRKGLSGENTASDSCIFKMFVS